MRYIDSADGINIPAGESRSYRVAYKKDYETFFNPDNPGEGIKGVKEINSKIHLSYKQLCVVMLHLAHSIRLAIPTIVSIRYGSIFGHKYTVLTQFYNTFLDGGGK
ncbi:hypothetical protein ACT691_06955 [Vibrio metschnikovii]